MNNQNKNLDYYMNLSYRTFVREDRCGECPCFAAYNPELEGCMAQGKTWQEALDNLKQARSEYIELQLELGWDVPVPVQQVPIPHRVKPVCQTASVRRPLEKSDRVIQYDDLVAA